MASSPEYDKEPKAPDKSATTVPSEDSKLIHNSINDQQTNSDHKSTHNTANAEVENNKHVETLDDGQLRALLDEAITYKCPKDREGKSSLFKELLEEVEQDEQACEAAARSLGGCRGARRGARARRALPHSNSLQDLVEALAAEPRRPQRHHAHHHPATVSARATQGGSLPSGVDTTSMVSEEPARGAGYLATVHCVNPPPLAERRVSASDANAPHAPHVAHAPHDIELLNRRSKPAYPMTYTARATLEIGSGSVGSGRAVTTTTASNQVAHGGATRGPPERFYAPSNSYVSKNKGPCATLTGGSSRKPHGGGGDERDTRCGTLSDVHIPQGKDYPRGPIPNKQYVKEGDDANIECNFEHKSRNSDVRHRPKQDIDINTQIWNENVNKWYEGLSAYTPAFYSDRSVASSQALEKNSHCLPNQLSYRNDYQMYTYPISGINVSYNSSGVNVLHPVITLDSTPSVIDKQNGRTATFAQSEVSKYLNNNVDKYSNLKKVSHGFLGKSLIVPAITEVNSKNIRRMTIGNPSIEHVSLNSNCEKVENIVENDSFCNRNKDTIEVPIKVKLQENIGLPSYASVDVAQSTKNKCLASSKEIGEYVLQIESNALCNSNKENHRSITQNYICIVDKESVNISAENDIELKDMATLSTKTGGKSETFSEYVAGQEKFIQAMEGSECGDNNVTDLKNQIEYIKFVDDKTNIWGATELNDCANINIDNNDNQIKILDTKSKADVHDSKLGKIDINENNNVIHIQSNETQATVIDGPKINDVVKEERIQIIDTQEKFESHDVTHTEEGGHCRTCKGCSKVYTVSPSDKTLYIEKRLDSFNGDNDRPNNDRYVLAELPNNAYIFLTLPKRLQPPNRSDDGNNLQIQEIEDNNNIKTYVSENNAMAKPSKKKKDKSLVPKNSNTRKETFNKNALKVLLFENQLKSDRIDRMMSIKSRLSPITDEVDSAIPFSCITTPEVVASCNTTSSTSQAAVAVDAKPLQLGSCYRAVASLTGAAEPRAAPPAHTLQPRSVIPSSYNGLPLSRPNYGSTATTAPDEFKKSLDENGNAVQGFSSPLAGSGQHKKPRRKKSSKNETVIDCRQIDGYQGDKDVNELLRFIESNAEGARAPKLSRAKHRDDTDDKTAKKRSTERRKDKDAKVKRATSLEEVSRTKLEDLTAGPRAAAAPSKPERRSWGEARDSTRHDAADPPDPVAELTDFQTVTKKRKPRRRADEPAPRRPRAPSPPSPPSPRAAPPSAPHSERSNDSNDDLDSAHSPPPAPAPAAPHASYADIARTRHNIPDLIESCNYYAEGEAEPRRAADPPPPPPPDADGYPALEARAAPAQRRARDAKPAPGGPRRDRKERPAGADSLDARADDCPAPDVVADRRPPVILLDAAARPGDMDGVTFGFDINEQLLSGPARRPRCDLLRDALEGCGAGARGGVAVRAGCAALRYVPPAPPADTHHLHQIVDYVGNAWEDVVRCGGKVRYFSE